MTATGGVSVEAEHHSQTMNVMTNSQCCTTREHVSPKSPHSTETLQRLLRNQGVCCEESVCLMPAGSRSAWKKSRLLMTRMAFTAETEALSTCAVQGFRVSGFREEHVATMTHAAVAAFTKARQDCAAERERFNQMHHAHASMISVHYVNRNWLYFCSLLHILQLCGLNTCANAGHLSMLILPRC